MVNVEEKNWYKLHAATYVQGEETSCELGVGLHNVSGNAEHLTVSGEIGTQRSTQLTASYEQPKPYDLPVTVRGVGRVGCGTGVPLRDSSRLGRSSPSPTTCRSW